MNAMGLALASTHAIIVGGIVRAKEEHQRLINANNYTVLLYEEVEEMMYGYNTKLFTLINMNKLLSP